MNLVISDPSKVIQIKQSTEGEVLSYDAPGLNRSEVQPPLFKMASNFSVNSEHGSKKKRPEGRWRSRRSGIGGKMDRQIDRRHRPGLFLPSS